MKSKLNENRPLKVTYSASHFGFVLSEEAKNMLGKNILKGYSEEYFEGYLERHHPKLIEVIEKLGSQAGATFGERTAKIRIHVLSGTKYYIQDYDGSETVIEPHDMIDASKYEEEDSI